uniref:Histone domain-containing protein n=1 Tax=Strongyloides papillosus TaxID=174720 RepID=A0A0N5C6P1_STREA
MVRTKGLAVKPAKGTQKAKKTISHSAVRSLASVTARQEEFPRRSRHGRSMPKRTNKPTANGVKALREIKEYQSSTKLLVPRAPMVRCIREVLQAGGHRDFRITSGAVDAIREAVESYLVDMFEVCNLFAIHAGRVTVMPKDVGLWKRLRK